MRDFCRRFSECRSWPMRFAARSADPAHFRYAIGTDRWQSDPKVEFLDRGSGRKRTSNERSGDDERRGMAGAGIGRHRHEPCLFRGIGDAPHAAAARRSRRPAHSGAFRKGGRLHGRRLCPRRRPARRVHGAVGRRRQSRLRPAGFLARAQPGHRADRPQGTVVPTPQLVSGNRSRAAVPAGDEIFLPGLRDQRIATPAASRLARRVVRHAAPDASRFQRPAGRCDRTWANRRTPGHRNRGAAHSAAPARCRRARHRARRRAADRRASPRDRRRRRRRRVRGRAGGAGAGRGARRAGRDDAGGARHHPDDAPPLGRGRRQLFGAARRTASCTAPTWCCSSAATPATRSR